MTKALKALLERAALLASRHTRLDTGVNRLQAIDSDAHAYVERLEAENEGYARMMRRPGELERELADLKAVWLPGRKVAAGVALYEAEREWPVLDAEVRTFREHSKQAPSAIAAYLRRTGGQRINLSDETEQLIELKAELQRARFRDELRDEPPSVLLALYAHARESDTDDAASLVRYVESRHGNGWAGRKPTSDQELPAAQELRRLIVETQDARVPPELQQIAETIAETAKLVNKAKTLHGIEPVNLQIRPDLRASYEAELQAVADLQHPEFVAS